MTVPFEELVGDRFIIGGPAECAQQVRRCAAATGATERIFHLHRPGTDHATVLNTLRLLGEKVHPPVKASRGRWPRWRSAHFCPSPLRASRPRSHPPVPRPPFTGPVECDGPVNVDKNDLSMVNEREDPH